MTDAAPWRFHLQEMPSGRWLDRDLPLMGGTVTTAVNAPASISGALSLGYPALTSVREWGCAVIAEQEGRPPVFGIVDHVSLDGGQVRVEAGGFTMYPTGIPWLAADYAGIGVDPLDVVRMVWDEVQSYPGGDLGVTVDSLRSPVRVGTPERNVNFTTSAGEDVSFDAGPFRLAWWQTDDVGKTITDLAASTPFGYAERSAWDGEDIVHRLELGYPGIGARRDGLLFEIGVNVTVVPAVSASEYASEVLLYGSGEGRTKIRSDRLTASTGRLRRVHVATEKAFTSRKAATDAARPILAQVSGAATIDSLTVVDHPMAPAGSFGPGDQIRVQGDPGWGDLDLWMRITELTVNCDAGSIELKVEEAV
ncbi:hypothetical protein [Tersicoccus sp. Bi-70]|uniref:hypothetical protein n=1 Tax=Tersicoccus sp. Bi-70 TaxID=1897634 RepID=UPI000976D629|nr:hypothetical protein [Tersicoccus sp. Bi-70]OMH30660.1 hypothetical protein BGP79_11925 [Tersicoccus sp. Bi-70]